MGWNSGGEIAKVLWKDCCLFWNDGGNLDLFDWFGVGQGLLTTIKKCPNFGLGKGIDNIFYLNNFYGGKENG